MTLEVSLFVEDLAHQYVIGALVQRVADDIGIGVRMEWRNAVGGHGKVAQTFKQYLRDIDRQGPPAPSFVVVATDANCKGYTARSKEIGGEAAKVEIVRAIPDPHVERWLLLDGAAFKKIFGKGCDAPDQKCQRDRYKELLRQAIQAAGKTHAFGGIEYAEDLVAKMDLDRAARADRSLKRFLGDLRRAFETRRSAAGLDPMVSAGDGVEQSSPRGRMNPTETRLGPRSAHGREEPHVG